MFASRALSCTWFWCLAQPTIAILLDSIATAIATCQPEKKNYGKKQHRKMNEGKRMYATKDLRREKQNWKSLNLAFSRFFSVSLRPPFHLAFAACVSKWIDLMLKHTISTIISMQQTQK